jgi:hypothetical protein
MFIVWLRETKIAFATMWLHPQAVQAGNKTIVSRVIDDSFVVATEAQHYSAALCGMSGSL